MDGRWGWHVEGGGDLGYTKGKGVGDQRVRVIVQMEGCLEENACFSKAICVRGRQWSDP